MTEVKWKTDATESKCEQLRHATKVGGPAVRFELPGLMTKQAKHGRDHRPLFYLLQVSLFFILLALIKLIAHQIS